MAKKTYSQKQVDIINVLADNPDGLTIAQMSEILGAKVQPGTVTGLVRAGLVAPVGVVQVKRPTKDQVSTYAVANADFVEDKKYSDSEKKILIAARTLFKLNITYMSNAAISLPMQKSADRKL